MAQPHAQARAVNQAIGRVIRHRHDYGAIIFLDERFAAANAVQMLPQWLRKGGIKDCGNFAESTRVIAQFFKRAQADPTLNAGRPQRAPVEPPPVTVSAFPGAMRRAAPTKARGLISVEPVDLDRPGPLPVKYAAASGAPRLTTAAPSSAQASLHDALNRRRPAQPSQPPEPKAPRTAAEQDNPRMAFQRAVASAASATPGGAAAAPKRTLYAPLPGAPDKEMLRAFVQEVKQRLDPQGWQRFSAILAEHRSSTLIKSRRVKTLAVNLIQVFKPLGRDGDGFVRQCEAILPPDERALFINARLSLSGAAAPTPVAARPATSGLSAAMHKKRRVLPDGAEPQQQPGPAEPAPATATAPRQGGAESKLCSACGQKPVSPFEAPCGHICCYRCWQRLRNTTSTPPRCPAAGCGTPFRNSQLLKRYFAP